MLLLRGRPGTCALPCICYGPHPPGALGRVYLRNAVTSEQCQLLAPNTRAEKFESFERINSIRVTNGNFDSCKSCKRLGTSRLHELHESKFPFVARTEIIRSKLSNFSSHISGVAVNVVAIERIAKTETAARRWCRRRRQTGAAAAGRCSGGGSVSPPSPHPAHLRRSQATDASQTPTHNGAGGGNGAPDPLDGHSRGDFNRQRAARTKVGTHWDTGVPTLHTLRRWGEPEWRGGRGGGGRGRSINWMAFVASGSQGEHLRCDTWRLGLFGLRALSNQLNR